MGAGTERSVVTENVEQQVFTDSQGKQYRLKHLHSKEEINRWVANLGAQIAKDYNGKKVLLVGILKGANIFLADIIRSISYHANQNGYKVEIGIDFMEVSSYNYTTSNRNPQILKDTRTDIQDKEVLLVEDIVDTGYSLETLHRILSARQPTSLRTATLLSKPSRRETTVSIDYIGKEILDKFVVGYGLDYEQNHRELEDIYEAVFIEPSTPL